jgi:hypothetical protein
VLGPDHSDTRVFGKASITLAKVDLCLARLALKILRLDQRQAIVRGGGGVRRDFATGSPTYLG